MPKIEVRVGKPFEEKFNFCAILYRCTAVNKWDAEVCYYFEGSKSILFCVHRRISLVDNKTPICYNKKACENAFDNTNPEHHELGMVDLHLKKIGNGNAIGQKENGTNK